MAIEEAHAPLHEDTVSYEINSLLLNWINSNEEAWYGQVKINGVSAFALYDTGAEASIVQQKVIANLPNVTYCTESPTQVTTFKGKQVSI